MLQTSCRSRRRSDATLDACGCGVQLARLAGNMAVLQGASLMVLLAAGVVLLLIAAVNAASLLRNLASMLTGALEVLLVWPARSNSSAAVSGY
jgi:hypothetical protein